MTAQTSPDVDIEPLRFVVVDEDDLAVMSAHLQDARVRPSDAAYLTATRRFAMVVCRVDHRALLQGRQERRETGFHFERVLRVQQSGLDLKDEARPLQLLAIAFQPAAAPGGDVLLTFAGGAFIRLQVECLEAELRDLGPGRPADDCPRHRLDEPSPGR